MVFGLHFFRSDDTLYNTFFINDESCAERSHIFAAHTCFFSPHTPNCSTSFLSVSAIRVKGRLFFSINFWCDFSLSTLTPMTFITGFAQVGIIIPQVAGLCRAAGCHVFGVEVKYNLLSLIVAQADFYTFFVDIPILRVLYLLYSLC